MRRVKAVHGMAWLCTVALLAMGALMGSAGPAYSWGYVTNHAYHFFAWNGTGGNVNGGEFLCTGTTLPQYPGAWRPPILWRAWSMFWLGKAQGVTGPWRWATIGPPPGPPIWPPGGLVWFNCDYGMRGWGPGKITNAWFRLTLNGAPVTPWRWLGWRIASPPALYNPAVGPDGPNSEVMVVDSLHFAVSPTAIPNEETTLDNPEVVALFATSPDPIRGANNVNVDSFFDILDLHPSITEPRVGGQTVLATGTVRPMSDQSPGAATRFIVQFTAQPDVPATSQMTLVIIALCLLAMGSLIVLKRRASANA